MNRKLNVVSVLETARNLMVTNWTKGEFRRVVSQHASSTLRTEYCAMGGIDEAVARLNNGVGLTVARGGNLFEENVEAMGSRYKERVIPKNPRTPADVALKASVYLRRAAVRVSGIANQSVVGFNDSGMTTLQSVIQAFDIAIRAAKRRRLPALPKAKKAA